MKWQLLAAGSVTLLAVGGGLFARGDFLRLRAFHTIMPSGTALCSAVVCATFWRSILYWAGVIGVPLGLKRRTSRIRR